METQMLFKSFEMNQMSFLNRMKKDFESKIHELTYNKTPFPYMSNNFQPPPIESFNLKPMRTSTDAQDRSMFKNTSEAIVSKLFGENNYNTPTLKHNPSRIIDSIF